MSCLAKGHKTVKPVRLDPTTPQSRVKHSTTALLDDCLWCVDNNEGFGLAIQPWSIMSR